MTATADDVRRSCERTPGATFDYPFGADTRVYKVGGKMFALVAEDGTRVSLKCDPALAEILCERYAAITPGYHLNKRHWITVALDGSVPAVELADMVAQSHGLVLATLPKRVRSEFGRAAAG